MVQNGIIRFQALYVGMEEGGRSDRRLHTLSGPRPATIPLRRPADVKRSWKIVRMELTRCQSGSPEAARAILDSWPTVQSYPFLKVLPWKRPAAAGGSRPVSKATIAAGLGLFNAGSAPSRTSSRYPFLRCRD